MNNAISLLGILVFVALAWILSSNRKRIKYRPVLAGLLMQLVFAALVFILPQSRGLFLWLSSLVNSTIEASREGLTFVFGQLGAKDSPLGIILACQVLPFIIVFSAVMGILYYLRVIPALIRLMARFIFHVLGTSGAEALCSASNIFVGIESATTIRPYIQNMTRSELFLILSVGMSTVASSVLAVYVAFLGGVFPTIAGHLISASILSVPAAFVICKLMEPETEEPETAEWSSCQLHEDEQASCLTEAAVGGAANGAKLAVGVGVTLIAFVGILGVCRELFAWMSGGTLTIEQLLGYVFYPFVWLMGVSVNDVPKVSELLGLRLILTEIPSYLKLAEFAAKGGDPRSVLIASYALCGFAHVASVAVFVGGIGAMAPGRMGVLSRLGFRALLAATLVTLMTGAVAGLFCTGAGILR